MIPRIAALPLERLRTFYPIVGVVGPRQSGKTTLCRAVFPDHDYVNLEAEDRREFALSDPRGFLASHSHGVILDEIQRTPSLFGYIQEEVDRDPTPGRFVLTGSRQFGVGEGISQSLAGRIGLLTLLPPGFEELSHFPSAPRDLLGVLWSGSYPRIYDAAIPPDQWLRDYYATYVERDVRQVLNIGDLGAFSTFVRLCAGRTSRELNLSTIGADAGVTHPTVRSWISVLEASFICTRVPPLLATLRKQLVKTPKLHFLDSGLVCMLLGIRSPSEVETHPLRGAIFESWVASEVLKAHLHRGLDPHLHHFRVSGGTEVDLVIDRGRRLTLVEAKSGRTIAGDAFRAFENFREHFAGDPREIEAFLVHGGDERQTRTAGIALPWREVREYAGVEEPGS